MSEAYDELLYQPDLFTTAAPPPETRRALYDVDYTPRAVPRMVFDRLALDVPDAQRILIPAAGAGSWAAEARARYPNAHITAVEVREEERSGLYRWCEEVLAWDIRDPRTLWSLRRKAPYDIIADNPAFSLLPRAFAPWPPSVGDGIEPRSICAHSEVANGRCVACKARKSQAEALRAFMVQLRPMLTPRTGRLALYHLSDLGQRSADAWQIIEEHPPLYQMRVQPMRHRATGGSDLRSYSVWTWGPGEARTKDEIKLEPATWQTWSLPRLEPHERRWTVVPGSEQR